MSIKFVADSACDIDEEFAKEHGIIVLPLTVSFGTEEYFDGVNLSKDEFYKKLTQSSVMPKTSLVNQFAFEAAFKEAIKDGSEVVAVLISDKMSGTYNAAVLAKQAIGSDKIHLINSENVTISNAALLIEAVKMREKGLSAAQITEKLNNYKKRLRLFVGLNTLKYVKEGGRLSSLKALIGAILSIKPIVSVKNGVAETVGKAIGFKKAQQLMVEKLKTEDFDDNMPVYFGYSDDEKAGKDLLEAAKKMFKFIGGKIFQVGSAVGTHGGPGACGIVFFTKQK